QKMGFVKSQVFMILMTLSIIMKSSILPKTTPPSAALGMEAHPTASEEKAASNLAAKLFLLDELVSLENEVTETKKKRSFPGFGSPIDRISATSVDTKGKQRRHIMKMDRI
uniref:Osteocrin n=1 Tax=Anas platyrhynchos platyrhynchos TaxID=8840 RepID=A0A493TDY6_ANAPP